MSSDEYEIGELVKVRLFGTRIHTAHYLAYPYFSYGVVIAKGASSYDDKEGYFIYWLKNQEQSEINEFYMSVKFFNAKIGQFVRMTTLPQSNFSKKFNLERQKYFYRKIILDYSTYEYEVRNVINNNRVGNGTPIKWYEYVNPS